MVLKVFEEFVNEINSSNSRLYKEAVLDKYKENEYVKQIVHFIFNPYIVTGISKKKIDRIKSSFISKEDIPETYDIFDLLNYVKLNNTGSDSTLIEVLKCAMSNKDYSELILKIVSKDIKLGIQSTTINKIWGDNFIPCFDVMLAQKYFDNPDKLVPEGIQFILTPKLDGVRCVLINDGFSGAKFFSRQGQLIEQLIELEEEAKQLPMGYVYDGELLLDNKDNLESKDLYRATVKVTSADKEKTNLIFNVFDMIPITDFQNGYCNAPASLRKEQLLKQFTFMKLPHIVDVPILYYGDDKQVITEQLDIITAAGGEGVMINIADAPYECKRSKGLLKVKKMQTCDVKVVGMEEGTGKNKGKLGALKIEFIGPDGFTYQNDVGSGLTDEDREYYWDNPDKILNKIIEIQYFEISANQQGTFGLRFPVFKWIREDKTDISMY